MNRSILHFAIIGCGRIAQRHAEHIYNKAVLSAVCDVIPEKADALAKKMNTIAYNGIEEMLGSGTAIDIVSVCSPNGLHALHSMQALNAGKHVICEKPMALTVDDCRKMIAAAEKNNRQLFVVKQNRYNPPVAAVKKLIEEGRLGTIYSLQLTCFWNRTEEYYKNSWKGTKDLDGGTLYTQFSHFIDLLYWMIGDVKEVHAVTDNFQHKGIIDFEDTGVVTLRFANGALGTINYTVNSHQKNMEGSLTVFGERGTVKIGGEYLNELEYQQIEEYKIENLPEGNKPNNYGTYVGSMSNHDLVYDNVIEVLENGGTITTGAFDGLKTVEIIQKIYASAYAK